ncbi:MULTISPECIES: phosphatase PAP2 family protein [Gracilibacillus]|nr:phosphatase PAP2 family protein [Gracilibacillus dipsosauri]
MYWKKWIPKDSSEMALIILIIGFAFIIGSTFLFIEIADDILEDEKFYIDQVVQDVMESARDTWFHSLMETITELGSVPILTIATIVLVSYLFLFKKRKWEAIFFGINMVGISLLTKGLKLIFQRDRPEILMQYDGTGFSFPSGHSTGSIAFYGFCIYLVARSRWKSRTKWLCNSVLSLLIVLIPLSRTVLSVHYFTDVLAGVSLGLAWLLVCIFGLQILLWRRRHHHFN